LPFASQPDLITIIYARWDGYHFFTGSPHQAPPAAGMAWRGNRFTLPIANWAGGHLYHRAEQSLAHLAHFACPITGGTSHRAGAWFRSLTSTGFTDLIPADLNFLFHPENRLFKGQVGIIL
jgi:hypothetical protein